ncbi:MAG: radical SAM protein [Patescibacteria group bacterium]
MNKSTIYSLLKFNRSLCWRITSKCNLNCPHCLVRSNPASNDLKTNEALEVVSIISQIGLKKLSFSGGEPLLRSDLKDIIRHAQNLGLKCSITTNGLLLNSDWLDFFADNKDLRLRISLDGPKDIHENFRGTNSFDKVYTKIAQAINKGVKIEINTVLTPKLINILPDFLNLLDNLRVGRVNFLTFMKRNKAFREDEFQLTEKNIDLAKSIIRECIKNNKNLVHVKINDYSQNDRHKLVIEPDGKLVSYGNKIDKDIYFENVFKSNELKKAIKTCLPETPINIFAHRKVNQLNK